MIIGPKSDIQVRFLACDADFALFGGAAGGGKTYALLLDALHFHKLRLWRGAMFRFVYADHLGPGGLWDEANTVWEPLGARMRQSPMDARWDSGARVQFLYADMKRWRKQVQGLQIAWAAFDEATHFPMEYIMAVHGRLRSVSGAKTCIRMSCNPDPDHELAQWVAPYLDENGYPDRSKSGMKRWFAARESDGKRVWGNTRQEAADLASRPISHAYSFAFYPATAADNKPLMDVDPDYAAKHSAGGKTSEEQLGKGNWHVRSETSGMLRRTRWHFDQPGDLPRIVWRCRAWDLAHAIARVGNEPPDFTASVRMEGDENGHVFVTDVTAHRVEAPERDRLQRQIAIADGPTVMQHYPIDPGGTGVGFERHIRSFISGPRVGQLQFNRPAKVKVVRAQPLGHALEQGKVHLVVGPWYDRPYEDNVLSGVTLGDLFWRHVDTFPDVKNDDIADAAADAYRYGMTSRPFTGGTRDTWEAVKKAMTRRAGRARF